MTNQDRDGLRREVAEAMYAESNFLRDAVAEETLLRCLDPAIAVMARRMHELAGFYGANCEVLDSILAYAEPRA
jgi:hypothetical protein